MVVAPPQSCRQRQGPVHPPFNFRVLSQDIFPRNILAPAGIRILAPSAGVDRKEVWVAGHCDAIHIGLCVGIRGPGEPKDRKGKRIDLAHAKIISTNPHLIYRPIFWPLGPWNSAFELFPFWPLCPVTLVPLHSYRAGILILADIR